MRRDRQTPKLHRSERAEKICVTPRVCQARSRTVRPGAMTGCGKPPRSVWNVRGQKCVGTATTIRHTPNRNHTNHNIDAIILTISSNRGPKSPRLSGVEQILRESWRQAQHHDLPSVCVGSLFTRDGKPQPTKGIWRSALRRPSRAVLVRYRASQPANRLR
jgi:hypothetical protein